LAVLTEAKHLYSLRMHTLGKCNFIHNLFTAKIALKFQLFLLPKLTVVSKLQITTFRKKNSELKLAFVTDF